MSKIFTQIIIKETIKNRTISKIKRHINHNPKSISPSIKNINWTTPQKNRKEKKTWVNK